MMSGGVARGATTPDSSGVPVAPRRMGPVDPRLLRHASAARAFLIVGAGVALLQTLSILGIAWFVTAIVVALIAGEGIGSLGAEFLLLAASILLRALCFWLFDLLATRGAARVKSQLRTKVVAAIGRLGPSWMSGRSSAQVTAVAANGLDALDGYFSKYLPQLILTVVAMPVLWLVLLSQDLVTAVIVAVTLPLIPLFMVLIGWATQAVQRTQWTALTTLASSFLDVVEGLSTLTVFGRQHRQAARIEAVTEDYRVRTMSVLRISFISGFVLELAGSLSVALVAVSIGVRLVDGELGLLVGLFVLLVTPEIYLPLRQVGAQFHASAEGVAAAQDVFEILDADAVLDQDAVLRAGESPVTSAGSGLRARGIDRVDLVLDGVSVGYGEKRVVDDLHARFGAGKLSVLSAPSGAGKSTLIAGILGFLPHEGRILFDDVKLPADAARARIAWAGQRPNLVAGTIAGNIALGAETIDEVLLAEAMRLAAASTVTPETVLGVNGAGLSGGQAPRVAVARAYYRALDVRCPIVILDEPTSALDAVTEERMIAGFREMRETGRTVIVISHRDAVVAASDQVLHLRSRAVVS